MLWHLVHHFQILGRDFNPWSLLSHDVCGLHDALGQESMAAGQDGCLLQGHAQGAPVHPSGAHGDLAGPQAVAELRGNGQQASS